MLQLGGKYYRDFIDDSRHGAGECSTLASRIRSSYIDMLGVPEFVGEDEALFFGKKDFEFASDETEILGEQLSKNPPIAVKLFSSRYESQERWPLRPPSMS